MNFGRMHDFSGAVKLNASLAPVAGTGSAQNGAAVNRQHALAAIVPFTYSTSGGVTGGTITVKIQDSTDGSTGWADYGSATSITLTGTNPSGVQEVAFNLSSAKQYVRAVVTSAPTGGTPASIVAAAVLLGGYDNEPQ